MNHSASYLLCLLLILCGCSNEITEEVNIEEKPVPILIASKEVDVVTKAVRNTFTSENISYIKIYGSNETVNLCPEGVSPIGINENADLNFSSSLLYPRDNSNITVYGFYPSNIQDIYQSTGTDIAFTISGQDDLMYAFASAGNKSNPLPVTLTFDHKLAQVKFKLKSNITDSLEPSSAVNIIATGPNTGTMDITNGNLDIASGTTGTFILSTGFTFGQLLTNDETVIPGELLLFPKSEYSFSLQIGDSYYPVTFDQQALTTSWNESSVYTLTISINSLNNPQSTPVVKENI